MRAILLLTISSVFMMFAWYGHLRFRSEARSSYKFAPAQLKTIRETITLSVFPVFSIFYPADRFQWNYGVGFALIVGDSVLYFPQMVD